MAQHSSEYSCSADQSKSSLASTGRALRLETFTAMLLLLLLLLSLVVGRAVEVSSYWYSYQKFKWILTAQRSAEIFLSHVHSRVSNPKSRDAKRWRRDQHDVVRWREPLHPPFPVARSAHMMNL